MNAEGHVSQKNPEYSTFQVTSPGTQPQTLSHGWEVAILVVWVWSTQDSGNVVWVGKALSGTLGVELSRGVTRWPHCSRGGAPSLPLIRRKLQFSQFKGSSRRHWSCDYKSLLLFWLHSGLSISLPPSLLHWSLTCFFLSLSLKSFVLGIGEYPSRLLSRPPAVCS